MQTKLTRLLGIEYPIIQGGMAWIADASLASAVSNAGGLGIISAMNAGADWVREEIRKCRAATDRPFGVNIMLMSPHVEEVAQMVAEEKVPVVTTGAGNPSRFVKLWKEAGVRILPVVASTALAKMVERAGVDAVIAEGGESGGHVGDLTTMALVPQVVDAVKIPVVAAGGIGDGRGMVAAFALGSSRRAASATAAAWSRRSRWAPAACRWARASSSRRSAPSARRIKRRSSPPRTSPRWSRAAVSATPCAPSKTRI